MSYEIKESVIWHACAEFEGVSETCNWKVWGYIFRIVLLTMKYVNFN